MKALRHKIRVFGFYTRVFILILQFVCNWVIPDHEAGKKHKVVFLLNLNQIKDSSGILRESFERIYHRLGICINCPLNEVRPGFSITWPTPNKLPTKCNVNWGVVV